METLLLGTVVVLVVIVGVLLLERRALFLDLEEAENMCIELSENLRIEKNKYQRKCYEVRELKKDIKSIANLTSMKTKDQIKFLLNWLIK